MEAIVERFRHFHSTVLVEIGDERLRDDIGFLVSSVCFPATLGEVYYDGCDIGCFHERFGELVDVGVSTLW